MGSSAQHIVWSGLRKRFLQSATQPECKLAPQLDCPEFRCALGFQELTQGEGSQPCVSAQIGVTTPSCGWETGLLAQKCYKPTFKKLLSNTWNRHRHRQTHQHMADSSIRLYTMTREKGKSVLGMSHIHSHKHTCAHPLLSFQHHAESCKPRVQTCFPSKHLSQR